METPTDRQERITWWQQDVLRRAHIAIVGAGALGNEVLKNLALVGVGNMSVFDFDYVELSNISRTVLFRSTDTGSPKAPLAAERTKDMSVEPSSSIHGYDLDIVWQLGEGYIRRMDLVLGCLDNLEARLRLGETCYRFGIPYIDGGIRDLGGMIQLHKTGLGACMSCTVGPHERLVAKQRYSCSQVMKSAVAKHTIATVQTTSALIASIMSQEALKYLHGRKVQFGRRLTWSGDRDELDNTALQRFDSCDICQVPPVKEIRELPLSHLSTVTDLFTTVTDVVSFRLPSDYIVALKCQTCGNSRHVNRPAFKCMDSEMHCSDCGSFEVALQHRQTLDSDMESRFLTQPLSHFGIPPLAVLFASTDFQSEAYELSADAGDYPNLKERN